MALKTDESSIHVLPSDDSKNKSTTATVESNLLDTNPDLYVKRAQYFSRKGMLTEAENEYNAALLFSHRASKYYVAKGRFYKDVLHDEKRADKLFSLSAWMNVGWIGFIGIGGNLIANETGVLGVLLLLVGAYGLARMVDYGRVIFVLELWLLSNIFIIDKLSNGHISWNIAFGIYCFFAVGYLIFFVGLMVRQIFRWAKRGVLRLFSKPLTFSDEELDAMEIIEPTPMEEVRRSCRETIVWSFKVFFIFCLISGVILVALMFFSGEFTFQNSSETSTHITNTVDDKVVTVQEPEETEPEEPQAEYLSPEEQQAIIEAYFGCNEHHLQQIGYMNIGNTERKVWRHSEDPTGVLFFLDIDSVVKTQGDHMPMESDYFHPRVANNAAMLDIPPSSTAGDISSNDFIGYFCSRYVSSGSITDEYELYDYEDDSLDILEDNGILSIRYVAYRVIEYEKIFESNNWPNIVDNRISFETENHTVTLEYIPAEDSIYGVDTIYQYYAYLYDMDEVYCEIFVRVDL